MVSPFALQLEEMLKVKADVVKSFTSSLSSSPPPPPQTKWTWGPDGEGAVLLVNCDRDGPSVGNMDYTYPYVRSPAGRCSGIPIATEELNHRTSGAFFMVGLHASSQLLLKATLGCPHSLCFGGQLKISLFGFRTFWLTKKTTTKAHPKHLILCCCCLRS